MLLDTECGKYVPKELERKYNIFIKSSFSDENVCLESSYDCLQLMATTLKPNLLIAIQRHFFSNPHSTQADSKNLSLIFIFS